MTLLYCTNTLWAGGGIEHITITKANALAAIEGNVVWIAVADNRFPPVMHLDNRVRVFDLNLNYYIDDHKRSRLSNLFITLRQIQLHKKKLKELFRTINPDIVISTDGFGKYFLPRLRTNQSQAFVREYHMWSKFHRSSPNTLFEKVLCLAGDFLNTIIIHKYDRVVVLTHEDKNQNWPHNDNVVVLPNPITITHSFVSSLEKRIVSAAGRLCHQKNYDLLIDSWLLVHQSHPDWILEIWGDGPDKTRLNKKISDLQLGQSVFLKGYDKNVLSKLSESSIFVLSSLYEGLPLVIIEALSCGIPVVATACPCGPKDLIIDGQNGFLVPVGNKNALAGGICRLIEDSSLRKQMGGYALEVSKQYSIERITSRWMDLFDELVTEKGKKLTNKR